MKYRVFLPFVMFLLGALNGRGQDLYIPDHDFRLMLKEASSVYGCMDTTTGMLNLPYWNQLNLALDIDLDEVQDGYLDLTGLDQLGTGILTFHAPVSNPMPTVVMPGYPQVFMHGLTLDGPGMLSFIDLSNLPDHTGTFACNSCGITELPTFDTWFFTLSLIDCDFSSGMIVPSTVTSLRLQNCQLSTCPVLPPALQLCYLLDNNISSLPALPATITYLDVSNDPLMSLPALPPALSHLYLNNVPLTVLPTMPEGLSYLDMDGISLQSPLDSLPDDLEVLMASGIAIDPLPPQLPSSLESLIIDDVPVSALPPLPASLQYLEVMNDTLLECLPALPQAMTGVRVQGTGITCLPNIPPNLYLAEWYVGIEPIVCDPGISQCPSVDPLAMGHIFNDLNSDGVRDIGEPARAGTLVLTTPGASMTASGSDGRFALPLGIGGYSVDGLPALYHTITTPAHLVNLTSLGQVDSLNDIGYHAIPDMYDLMVADVDQEPARPGMDALVHALVQNVGTEPADATITFVLDADRSWMSSNVIPASLVGNTATWNILLAPGEQWEVNVTAHTDAGVASGTVITDVVSVAIAQTDQTPENNTASTQGAIVASFDPNDKQVSPTTMSIDELLNGGELTYTIRFQNTGTAIALRVVVADTLSDRLLWDTFRFVASSHACTWHMINGVVYFILDPIELPDSTTDEPASHGFVKFLIRPVTDLLPGEDVQNEAAIYFDYNTPVITPWAIFSAPIALSSPQPVTNDPLLFPDPVSDLLNVRLDQSWTTSTAISVMDCTGHLLLTRSMGRTLSVLDVHHLSPGIYMLRISSNGREAVTRFIKR